MQTIARERATVAAPTAELVDFRAARSGAVAAAWRALAKDAPPFLSPEFFALTRPMVRSGEPLVAAAWDGGAMIGALPLVLDGAQLSGFGSLHTPELDLCGSEAALDQIWWMLRRDPRWSRMVLRNVPVGSVLATRLPLLARVDGCPVIVRAATRHPVFALAGFEQRMSSKFRANLERCVRKSGVVFERITSPTRADLDEAFAIEAKSWKGAAGTSISADPVAEHLYRAATRLFGHRGQAQLTFLRADGRRLAMMISVEDATTLYALKIGIDPAAAAWSPGHLMIWRTAQDAERRGLTTFDFVGHDDEWKKKWTSEVREHATLIVYRRSARGLAEFAARERVAPIVRRWIHDWRSPLPRGCQRGDTIGTHTRVERARGRVARGFGIRSGLRRALKAKPARVGAASRFAEGAWVQVRDEAAVRATLDERGKLRGLAFTPEQWSTCGRTFRVARVVRRLRDDHGRMRPVGATVLLDGVTCAGEGPEPAGCGRHCPLMFRDEWLAPAEGPHRVVTPASRRHARVRELAEITAGLDLHGRRDGLTFMPEMARHAGKRFPIAGTIERVFELDRWTSTPRPVYLLDGLRCTGAVLGARGPCDRACALLWHEDWLVIE